MTERNFGKVFMVKDGAIESVPRRRGLAGLRWEGCAVEDGAEVGSNALNARRADRHRVGARLASLVDEARPGGISRDHHFERGAVGDEKDALGRAAEDVMRELLVSLVLAALGHAAK